MSTYAISQQEGSDLRAPAEPDRGLPPQVLRLRAEGLHEAVRVLLKTRRRITCGCTAQDQTRVNMKFVLDICLDVSLHANVNLSIDNRNVGFMDK